MSKYLVLLFLFFLGCKGNVVDFPFVVYEKSFKINYTIVTRKHDLSRCVYRDVIGNFFISTDCSFNIGDTLTISNVQKP
jgi:hypothetical protein